MKIAIIGSGISGMTAAYLLHQQHDVTVFEANDYIGGHTHTVDVPLGGQTYSIDTGFIVFNDRTYPNFIRLLDRLGVESQPTEMSFSLRCDRTGIEYNGTSLNGLFAQRSNLFRPSFYRMLLDIMRFNRESLAVLEDDREDLTIDEYLKRHGYSRQFAEQYLIPMGAAIWSCPPETFGQFPIRFIVEFYRNHGLLSLTNRPQWRTIVGGSQRYVEKLTAPYRERIRLNSPVVRVARSEDGVEITVAPRASNAGSVERFEHVVFACHSDQALRMLGEHSTQTEREVLGEFPYQRNMAVLHTDTSVLPRRRLAWASWNYHIRNDGAPANATLSYNMSILQRLNAPETFSVTLNSDDIIAPSKIIGRYEYEHPIYTTRRRVAQQRHHELININRTSYCGAYWGYGFHEDGVKSALAVGAGFGITY